jgi:phosphoglucosamine mutase
MALRFGTDGVRGVANVELTPEVALALGRAAARVLHGGRFIIGRDTRRSGPMLEAALAAGLASEGASVVLCGVVPTPGVAWMAAQGGSAGAVISGSHNPFTDNGIKLFAPGGLKLGDDLEAAIETEWHADVSGRLAGDHVGTILTDTSLVGRYEDWLVDSVTGRLDGLRVVLDTAHGAATRIAPEVFRRLGATVRVLHDAPNGMNINDGAGALYPAVLADAVVAEGADAGLAFDGDADRLIAVDASGRVVDGDHLMAICALDRHTSGGLVGNTVVVTVMTNLGFRKAMTERSISVVETAVGDRYVLEALDRGGYTLGGEQSGHIIFRDLATTGDGILSGLQVLDVMTRSGRSLDDLAAAAMTQLPQVLINVKVAHAVPDIATRIAPEITEAEKRLGGEGRVLVRASGTEPLIRVMVEAPTEAEATSVADVLVEAALRACGTPQ